METVNLSITGNQESIHKVMIMYERNLNVHA